MDNSIEVKLEALGRVTIPIQYRRALGIDKKESVYMKMEDNKIIILLKIK